MHIYAFGSVCRGDIDPSSDVDLLALVDGHDDRFDQFTYSIYSYERIKELWGEGNPFAWHLSLESKLIFASDENDFLGQLGEPAPYLDGHNECKKFYDIFKQAVASFSTSDASRIFDLSSVFLAIRNFATCYSLSQGNAVTFSRNSALELGTSSLSVDQDIYDILKRSQILCTRAYGVILSEEEMSFTQQAFPAIEDWMLKLLKEFEV
ncbi:nucleotidyltransferase domain-containing protein [Magnetovibrio sp. PR-2]|uniref:nucleotidyltransferase domain-containing protein n=1 Tax=Magnetovibrio sp. PR-2 TaxID=3120356 RepID=UPI002FCE26DB